jgi:hypothetical protein
MEYIYISGDETALTNDQIRELAVAIQEDFGVKLSRTNFCDKLLLMLEDVPGCESGAVATALIDTAWTEYTRYQRAV